MNNKLCCWLMILSFPILLFSAALTQSNVTGYWAFGQGGISNIGWISTEHLTVDAESRVNPSSWDVSPSGSEVLGKALGYSAEQYMVGISGDIHLAGIYNGPTSGEFGGYDTSLAKKWEIYQDVSNSTLTIDNITSTLPSGGNNQLIIRNKAAGSNFSVQVGEMHISGGNKVSLGTESGGCFIENLTLGDSAAGGSVNVSGGSTIDIRAANIASYVDEINISGGTVNIYKGVSNDTSTYTDCSANFSKASLNISGSGNRGVLRFGSSTSDKMAGDFLLGDISIESGSDLGMAVYSSENVSFGNVVADGTSTFTLYAGNFTVGDVVHSAKTSWLIGRNTLGNGVETTTFSGSKLILAGTDADNLAEMSVYTRYLNSSSLQNVEISNGTLAFFGGAYDNGAGTEYYGFDLDLQNATVKLSGKTKLQYGYTWNNTIDGVARIGDLVLDCDGMDSEWLIYSSQSICMYINSISSETQGGSGSVLEWKFNNKNVYVQNDAEIAVETFLLYGQLHVLGNYLNGFDGESLMHYQSSGNGNFYVTGTFETKGTFAVCFDAAFTSTKTIMNVGGIVGGTSGSKITTGYNYEAYSNNTGVSIIALRGAGSYSTTTALVDFSAGANPTELALNGALGINKTGEGVQYLRGENMYRGQTTVSAGELYINASGSGNSAGWGIGAVSLTGGKFGAVGASGNIGKIVATDLTWSNSAMIAVDFAADGTSDLISLSGNFLKAEGDAEGQYMFDFSGVFAAEETKYQIMSWESDSTVEFTESDFGYTYNGEINSLNGSFLIENNSLYFVSVPEPAEYAAIFGMLALGLALWRRRK